MRALCWHGHGDIRCDTVTDPKIVDSRDAIIRVTSCAICGSDLHLMGGFVPTMHKGDVLGHETMGEVVEVGSGAAHKLKIGDRVVVPFTISCGNAGYAEGVYMHAMSGAIRPVKNGRKLSVTRRLVSLDTRILTEASPGGQAQYLRVPYADVGPITG